MERTFAIIKPDAVGRGLAGQILARVEAEGFAIRAMRMVHLSKREAQGFYHVHRERPFFGSLTDFMSSGPCIVLALEAADAIRKWRDLMGATDPAKAAEDRCAGSSAPPSSAMPRTGRMHRRRPPSSWAISSRASTSSSARVFPRPRPAHGGPGRSCSWASCSSSSASSSPPSDC